MRESGTGTVGGARPVVSSKGAVVAETSEFKMSENGGSAGVVVDSFHEAPVVVAPATSGVSANSPSGLLRRWLGGRWLGTTLVAAVAFVAGWAGSQRAMQSHDRETLPPAQKTRRDPAAVMVDVAPVAFRTVQRTVDGVGTLHGYEEVVISARREGNVRRVRFDVADRVNPGDLLLEIDPTEYTLAVEQAERTLEVEMAKLGLTAVPKGDIDLEAIPAVMQAKARRDNARSKLERVNRLAAARAISTEEKENFTSDDRAAQAEFAHQLLMARSGLATVRMKQAALDVARQQLDETKIVVPTPTQPVPGAEKDVAFAVTRRDVSEGTLVRPGTEIGRLVILQTLKLRVPIPERYGAEVAVGQAVDITTAAFPQPFAGTVARVNPAVDPESRTFEVEISVPNSDGKLKPGSFAKAALRTRRDDGAATVPLSAVVHFAGIHKIFLHEDGVARERKVTTGLQEGDWIEIVDPALPRGAEVITSGQSVLADDTAVEVRDNAVEVRDASTQVTSEAAR